MSPDRSRIVDAEGEPQARPCDVPGELGHRRVAVGAEALADGVVEIAEGALRLGAHEQLGGADAAGPEDEPVAGEGPLLQDLSRGVDDVQVDGVATRLSGRCGRRRASGGR